MAETVQEKAYIYYRRHRRGLFLLDFENAIYSITLGKVQGMDKARQMAARMTDVWGPPRRRNQRGGLVLRAGAAAAS